MQKTNLSIQKEWLGDDIPVVDLPSFSIPSSLLGGATLCWQHARYTVEVIFLTYLETHFIGFSLLNHTAELTEAPIAMLSGHKSEGENILYGDLFANYSPLPCRTQCERRASEIPFEEFIWLLSRSAFSWCSCRMCPPNWIFMTFKSTERQAETRQQNKTKQQRGRKQSIILSCEIFKDLNICTAFPLLFHQIKGFRIKPEKFNPRMSLHWCNQTDSSLFEGLLNSLSRLWNLVSPHVHVGGY